MIHDNLSPAGRGKIRYIGGYVVAKIKYRISNELRSQIFDYSAHEKIEMLQRELELLDSLCISEADIQSITNDEKSLNEIKRKQNITIMN